MENKLKAAARLLEVMDTLREKCPWDREQTFESLRNNTIEETYELVDAIADGNMVMATNDNGLMTNLYGSATVNAKVGKKVGVTLKMESNYPFEETIRLSVDPAKSVTFPLYMRVPAWCDNASVKINGTESFTASSNNGYIKISRKWQKGDKVELVLPMKLWMREWKKNKNSVSVNYGPLTFSLLIKENYIKKSSKETAIGDSRWQEGADADAWPSW